MFFSASTSGGESAKCPEQNVLSPARVTDSLSSYQIRPLHLPSRTYLLTAQFFFVSFTLFSASKFNTSLRSEKEWNGERKKLAWILSLLHLSLSALLPHSSLCLWLRQRLERLYAGSTPAIIWFVPLWRNSDSAHRLLRHQLLLPQ